MCPSLSPSHGSPWGSGVDPALGQAGAAAQLSDGLIAPFQGRIYASCSPGVTWATTALTEVCPGSVYTKPHHKGFFFQLTRLGRSLFRTLANKLSTTGSRLWKNKGAPGKKTSCKVNEF